MQIQSKEVLFFVEVTNFSSFSDAAEAMNIPQPTVSRRILELEGKIRSQLFLRSKAGVVLTEFGEQFLSGAIEVKQSLNALKKLATQESENPCHVVVEALQPIATLLVNDFLPYFRTLHPDVVLEVRSLTNREQHRKVGEVLRLQSHKMETRNNCVIHFLQAERNFYAPPQLLTRYPEIQHPEDILHTGIPCIAIQQPSKEIGRWHYKMGNKFHELKVNPTLIVDDAIKARDALLNDIGVSWNFDIVMNDSVKNGAAVTLFEQSFSSQENAYITYKATKQLTEPEHCFVEALLSYYVV
ncbi:LysR family transcriptional regulator [Vibrio hippocampi]|uniref:HTH-type transcriptional regulator HdfR n=1 Tax=Vibrio hippocampi TaxID=654686 RepID=A0ABM8ZMY5_9VIBR|nr:LysR family transcriptional regulator [Vibrio hippocampi]CAH0529797.1 HTH-type transcriptional regulator HdfR [Vibrio hippocampi]